MGNCYLLNLLGIMYFWFFTPACESMTEVWGPGVLPGYPITCSLPSLPLPNVPHGFHTLENRVQALGIEAYPDDVLLWVIVSAFAIPQQVFACVCSSAQGHSREWPSLPQLLHIQRLSHSKESEKCPFKHPELLLTWLIVPQGQSSPHAGWNKEQCSAEGTKQLWSAASAWRTPAPLHC